MLKRIKGVLWEANAVSQVIWVVCFALAYTQAPLYSSNQNQYFLHGLARAGKGLLSQDWLANTIDPTPAFSRFVQYHAILFPEWGFYLYGFLLMGLYFYCLMRIALLCRPLDENPWLPGTLAAILIFLHSYILDESAFALLGFAQEHLLTRGLKSQWLLGHFLQPSSFGVLLLAAIMLALQRRWKPAFFLLPLTATIHPTYLLPAGLLTIAFMLMRFLEERKPLKTVLCGVMVLLLVLPILNYVYTQFGKGSEALNMEMRSVLVNFRIPHHIIRSTWQHGEFFYARILVMIAGVYASRRTRLFPVMVALFSGGFLLTVIKLLLNSDMLALIFPWRVSTLLVPLSLALILSAGFSRLNRYGGFRRAQPIIFFQSWISVAFAVVFGCYAMNRSFLQYENAPEMRLMQYVQEHKSPQDLYLIPGVDLEHFENFRLVTGAPILVDFKSIPYRSDEVYEWHARIRQLLAVYAEPGLARPELQKLRRNYPLTHVVASARAENVESLGVAVYRDRRYQLIRLSAMLPPKPDPGE